MDILRSESDALVEILEQISLLSELLEKRFIIKIYFQEGNIEEIKRLFFIDQKIVDDLFANHQGEAMKSFNIELKTIYEGIDFYGELSLESMFFPKDLTATIQKQLKMVGKD